MSPRRAGWDFAQVSTSLLAETEFQKLRGMTRSDLHFLAAVGLWTVANAHAWRKDDDHTAAVLESYPGFAKGPEYLRAAGLIREDDRLVGFAKWTETVRRVRAEDAARKRGTPPDSDGNNGTPVDFPRGVGVGVEDVEIPPKPPRGGSRKESRNPRSNGDSPRQREEQVKNGLLAAFKEIGGLKSMPGTPSSKEEPR